MDICIYDRVTLQNGKEGEVQFMGMIEGKDGVFYGIKLDEPQGKNDGTFEDIQYFECYDKYGIFVTANKIKKSEPTKFNEILPRVCIGDRVHVKHKRQHGILRFVGIVEFQQGCWYGVELEEPLGKNNGCVDDRQYFECMEYYGIFCQVKNIESTKPQKKNLKVQKPAIRSSSDIAQIKNNYNASKKGASPTPIVAPPPPMAEPPVSPRSKKNQQNLLEQDIESMGFIQLKARCGMEGLSTFGTKKQLLGRLRQHLQKQGNGVTSNNNNNSNGNSKNKLKTDHNVMTKPNGAKHKKKNYSTQVNSYQNSQPKKNNNNNGINKTKRNSNNNTPVSRNSNNNTPVKSNNNGNSSWNAYNPDEDPELQDVDPEKDDFFKPIATGNNDDSDDEPNRQGSVIYNRGPKPKKATTNPIGALADEEEPDSDDDNQNGHKSNMNGLQKPALNASKSTPEYNQQNPNNSKQSPFENQQKPKNKVANNGKGNDEAKDWIMLPDPKSGKMYYANLKTKETRWQPPPGFGTQEQNLNPAYNPQVQFQHPQTNNLNQYARQYPNNAAVWQTVSTNNLSAYANGGNNQGQFGGQQPGFIQRQVSPWNQIPQSTNNLAAYANQQQYNNQQNQYMNAQQQFAQGQARSAMNMSQMPNGGMPTSQSAMVSPASKQKQQPNKPMPSNNKSKNKQPRKASEKPKSPPTMDSNNSVDPLTLLEAQKWKKTTDPTTGREYWYHKETKQTTWTPPPAVVKAEAVGAVRMDMKDIGKAEWEHSDDDDYSTSGSFYSDDESEYSDETEMNDDQKNQYQQQPNMAQGNSNGYNNGQQQQWGNNNGYNPQQQQWGNNGYNPAMANNQGQWGNNNGYNNNPNQRPMGNQPQQGGYPQQAPYRPKKQDSARQMYLKPTANNGDNAAYRDEKSAEDNPWISAEEAKSRVIVRDTLKRYWQIGAEQGFKLDAWAKENYALAAHKKGIFGKKQQSIADILSYADFGKLKSPLNKASCSDDKLKDNCMQTWKNINSYMGIRKSGKSSEGHVEKLVRYALKGDDKLRNEIYCQLAKQTTKNPKLTSLLKGWKLLLICCSFFPPSDQFVDYLACFIWNNTQQPNEIGQYAIKALHALDATMLSGGRKFPPLPLEIVKLENLQPIPLNIYFINGMKCKQVLVTSQTRAKQVIETLAQTFNFKHPEAFGLYEMEPNIPPLDKMKKHYIKRELMSQQEKINDLIRMPFERELEDDDRMLDVIASWLKRDQSKRRKKDDGKKKKKHHKSSKNVRFVLKVKTFRKSMEKQFSHMGSKANFLTHVWHVVNDFYPITIDDEEFAFDLAALQLQGTYGPKPKLKPTQNSKFDQHMQQNNDTQKAFYKPGLIAYDLHKYLGQAVLKKYLPGDRNSCEGKILQYRANKFSNYTRHDCWLRYAKMLRSNKKLSAYFGGAWYRGVRIQGDGDNIGAGMGKGKGKMNDYHSGGNGSSMVKADRNTNDLLVGINEHAITFVNPITQNVVERYQMEEILTFGYRSNAFLFVAGTLMTQSKMQIATMHGKAMNRLVRTHIDLRVRDAEKKGQKVNIPTANNI